MEERVEQSVTMLRECSWTDSDSPTEKSEEETYSGIQGTFPRPTQPFKPRLSHKIRLGTEDLMEAIEEAEKCIVGFLLDLRRFSSETI
ncbi:helicase-like transcription factor-like protein [Corchorus olitorius]|uniref:Helicase-like transcription factor-like protein n=1 Tax=Corchorus olitorius TaxID=93759 RepID=A0A1R3KTT7_9ROSI|nr:helicase-like transcription factor-like protein [Corchorus olitorius]